MDKEQARFILQSFRPDGADARDPDFAEALAVAASDRELGNWLASERAQDAAFAAALNDLAIPANLRESILSVLRGEPRDEADFTEMDAVFVGALATVRPPAGLRDQIVAAMQVETRGATAEPRRKSASRQGPVWLKPAAIAAALVLGAFAAIDIMSDRKPPAGANQPAPRDGTLLVRDLEREFITRIHSGPALDLREGNFAAFNAFLQNHDGPSADGKRLPRGLEGLKSVGCQLLLVGKTNASLLCFDAEDQTVHLVVVRREDLAASELAKLARLDEVKSARQSCRQCPVTKISVAEWSDDDSAFFLLGRTDPDELRERFF